MSRQLPDLVAARGDASQELSALLVARAELDSRLDELELQQRAASEAVARLSAELSDLERAAAAGEQVSDQARAKAEQALEKARLAHAAPWAERREGLRAAARDADQALTAFVAEHFDALYSELKEDASAAAEGVNRACRMLESAYAERQRVEVQVTSLAAMIRNPRPGDVERTRAEPVVREASKLLESGGEAAPRLKVDPRAPRHGEAVAEVEPAA